MINVLCETNFGVNRLNLPVLGSLKCRLALGYSANAYYPFGMVMPGRSFTAGNQYRYGFNGKENDRDINGGAQDYGMRMYDSRLGKFLSIDPVSDAFSWNSPYDFAENDPVGHIDYDGLEKAPPKIMETVEAVSHVYEHEIVQAKTQISKTTDKKVIQKLNVELDIAKRNLTKLILFRYKYKMNNAEAQLYYLNEAALYMKKILDISPAGDIKVIATGQNFQGEDKSRTAAVGWLALDVFGGEIFGVVGKTLKGLKYADKFGKCAEFASEFSRKFGSKLIKDGATVSTFEINIGKRGLIGTAEKQLADNGMHQFVEVVKDGKSVIFDNLHPEGLLKDEYVKQLAGFTSTGSHISGETLVNTATKIK